MPPKSAHSSFRSSQRHPRADQRLREAIGGVCPEVDTWNAHRGVVRALYDAR
jgi:hypothetical protein